MEKILKEYIQGKCIGRDDNGKVVLGKEFKKTYKELCMEEGVNVFIDFEIFTKTSSSCKDTVAYKLIKKLDGMIK